MTTRDAAKQTFKVALAQPPIADPHICGVMSRNDQGTRISRGLWGGVHKAIDLMIEKSFQLAGRT